MCMHSIRVVLVKARSVVKKSFILNDFFNSHHLDFLFIAETWLRDGDLSPFTEGVPSGCNFFNSPRHSGHGGGLATIVLLFSYQKLNTALCTSFKHQLFELSGQFRATN